MTNRKFRVGQRVVYIKGNSLHLVKGKSYTVSKLVGTRSLVLADAPKPYAYSQYDFDPVKEILSIQEALCAIRRN